MELTELSNKLKELLNLTDVTEAPQRILQVLFSSPDDVFDKWLEFCPDLSSDNIQPVFQYYMADRKDKKQDYTPKTLAKAACMLADVKSAHTIYDMCAGSGALTIQAWNINPECHFICQELDAKVIPLLLFNLAVRNISGIVINGDILSEEQFKAYKLTSGEKYSTVKEISAPVDIKADICISNPPYNLKWELPVFALLNECYKVYGVPPKGNANYAFILAAIQVAEKAVLILPNSICESNLNDESEIRQQLIEHNIVDSVVINPNSMFESTDIGTCLLSLSKSKTTATVEMVDMRRTYTEETRLQNGQYGGSSHTNRTYSKTVNVYSDENIGKMLEAINKRQTETEFCKSVNLETLKQYKYSLNASKYIDLKEFENIHRDYGDILKDINRIIAEKNSCKLIINETLAKRLGFDISLYKAAKENDPLFGEVMEKLTGEKQLKEDYISFTKNKGEFTFKANDSEHLSTIFLSVYQMWKQHIMYLNEQENVYLAEMRDALLPDLMSGSLEI